MNSIILRKKRGEKLTKKEIFRVIEGTTTGEIPDYQIAALLMAICFQGMDVEERSYLTQAMAQSGENLDFSTIVGIKVDKHSTGGVGDKISLMLAPWLAAAGKYVPMISGRGLGFTGGTLDKLAAIPGYTFESNGKKLTDLLRHTGCFVIGQSAAIAPADRKIYALRDVTATVDEISLITASILSKKLTEDLNELVMDVKCGSGAFMQNLKDAKALAQSIALTARQAGVETSCLITAMDYPLGRFTGNTIETFEAFEFCKPQGIYIETAQKLYGSRATMTTTEKLVAPLVEITVELAAAMLDKSANKNQQAREKAIRQLLTLWQDGSLYRKMQDWVSSQKGSLAGLKSKAHEILAAFEKSSPTNVFTFKAKNSGYLAHADGRAIGNLMVDLGAGRKKSTDAIDDRVSLEMLAAHGTECKKESAILRIYKPDLTDADRAQIQSVCEKALNVIKTKPKPQKQILARL